MKTLIVAVILTSSPLPTLRAQSLGALAKAEDARRATIATPAKVTTNKDLTPDDTRPPAALAAVPATAGTDAAATALGIPPAEASLKKDEPYWRNRLAPLNEKLIYDLKSTTLVLSNLSDLRSRMQPTSISLAVFGPELIRQQSELSRWEAILAEDRRAIADVKEEARRAGALPGWLR